ncbi:hypothetical protein M9H77_33531 [Catharanthus roseus]|uniref:Uncharacterized protein n=1 Tax=Catharanthus roseus TaxID=4058 RepID=A0ACB9ZIQ5_CATRO|nr:hypothetical protein M9H77_33531 [Catharanthus roseus]
MVRPSGRRGDADLSPIMDRTCRVEGRPVTVSFRGEAGSSTQPPVIVFRSRPPLQPHLSHKPVPYEPYGSEHPPSHPTDTVYDPYLHAPTMLGAARQDSSCSTHGYSHAEYGVSSSDPYVPGPADMDFDGDRGLTASFMSVMSKFAGSRNKRPEVARDVPAPTQKRKKVKASDWEQTKAAEGGPVDPELIPSYGGHVVDQI